MRILLLISIACLGITWSSTSSCYSADQKWGTLKGQIIFDGTPPRKKPLVKNGGALGLANEVPDESLEIDPETKGIENFAVYLLKRPTIVHPDREKVFKGTNVKDGEKPHELEFKAKNFRFEPHVLIVPIGAEVRVKSEDAVVHNIHVHPLKNAGMNVVIAPNQQEGFLLHPFGFKEKLPVKVCSDIYPWMSAYWISLDHPYAAVTDKEGRYEIPDLPVGEHEFQTWHELYGWHTRYQVDIVEGINEPEPLTFEKP